MVIPMMADFTEQIAGWTYEDEYSVYSLPKTDDTVSELLCGDYYAYLDPKGSVAGYFCFGPSARIPAMQENAYAQPALDFGLGLAPDRCGYGHGVTFVQTGLDFARSEFRVQPIRLTVAAFNRRAIRTYEKTGFVKTAEITHRLTKQLFYIMIRP